MNLIHRYGNENQKIDYLIPLSTGNLIGSFGMTEPNHGSDPSSMLTRFEKKNEGFILNGSKLWIGHAPICNVALIWAKNKKNEYGLFLIDRETKGFQTSKIDKKWGFRSSETGELIFMDYGDESPFMTYGVANPDGTLRHETPIELPAPRLPHDLGFSTNYTVLHDLPFFHDMDVLRDHNMRVLGFHKDIPSRFGVIPRYGINKDIRWFECEPCFILHVSNCWEEGDWLVMDGCRSTNPMPDATNEEGALSHMLAYMRLEANSYRWRFNLVTGQVREGDIDDLNTEFNKINQIYHLKRYFYDIYY